jgi:hypothetical protein
MKNKHLLFAVTLVLTAGLTGFSQTAGQGKIELTGDSGKKALNLDPQNPETFVKARRVNQFTGTINVADLVRAQEQVRELSQKGANSFNLAWDELGPNNVGGRTRAVLIDKDDSNIIFSGSVGGGVWKSTTRGTSWSQSVTTDGGLFQNQVVSCITQSTNGDIYVGTGEGFADVKGQPDNQYFGVAGQGIYKSTDRGNTFARLNSTWNNAASQETFLWVNAIAADPTDGNRIYAATRKGLRVSNDGGSSWTNPIAGLDSVAQDVVVGSDGTVVASIDNIAYVSTDGSNFTKISAPNGVENGLINESANITRLKFAIAPSDPNFVYCAAVGLGSNSQLENIYQSKDKGSTWAVIGPGGSGDFQPFSSVGDYNLAMSVDPANPEFIIVGGFNLWTWSYATGWERITLDEPTQLPFFGYYVHRNQHSFAWSAKEPNVIYAATNGGVSVSKNRGRTWSTVNKNLNTTQFFSVAFSNKGEILGGSLDNGTLYIDYQGNDPMYAEWWGGGVFSSFLGYRHGGDVAISMIDPNIQFFSTSGGTLHKRLLAEGQVTTREDYYGYANGGAFISPVALWESWNDPKSWDSVMFIADRDYAAGETLIVESALGKRPLKQVLGEPLATGDTVKIQDTYQAMIAVGKNDAAAVKVNRGAINPRSDVEVQRWYSIIDRFLLESRTGETNTGNQVVEIAFSHDGNHLYTAINHSKQGVYKLYRISNLENARSRSTMDATTGFNPETGERTYVQTTTEIGQFTQIPTSITVHPGNPDVVLVTTGNYGNDNFVYLATAATQAADSSMAFVPVQGNLPQAPVFTAMFNSRDAKEVIVGTEYGVYSTKDIFAGSPTWASENGNGMDIVPVMAIKQQHLENNAERGVENHGTIYASTFGRGFFKSETFSTKGLTGTSMMVNNETNIAVSIMPNPVADYAEINYTMNSTGDVSFEIFDMTGKVVKQMQLDNQSAGDHQLNIDAADLEPGAYFVRMKANNQQTSMKFMVR